MQRRISISQDRRWRRLGLVVAGLAPLTFLLSWTAFRVISRSGSYAAWSAGVLTIVTALSVALVARGAWAARPASRWHLNAILASWAVLTGLTAALLAHAFGLPAGWAAVLGVAAGAVAALAHARKRADVAGLQTVFPLDVTTLADAELLRLATLRPGPYRRLTDEHRAVQRLNHARALTVLAIREGDYDRLVQALPLLHTLLTDGALDVTVARLAAKELVQAENLLAERGRAGGRYAEAIELFARFASESGAPGDLAALHTERAVYLSHLARRITEELEAAGPAVGHPAADARLERLRELHEEGERELRAAVRLTDDRAPEWPDYVAMLGLHLCSGALLTGVDQTDDGVDLCRQALARPSGRGGVKRRGNELFLASALLARFDQSGDPADLDEAERLARRLLRLGNPVEARARTVLLEIAVRHEQLAP